MTETCFEVHLHAGRILLAAGFPNEYASNNIPNPVSYKKRIKETNYLHNYPTL